MIVLAKTTTTIRLDKPDNGEHIRRTLDSLGEVWKKVPNLSLTQVMQVVTGTPELERVSDHTLIAACRRAASRL